MVPSGRVSRWMGCAIATSVFLVGATPALANTPTTATIRAGMERALASFKAAYKGYELRRRAVVLERDSDGKLISKKVVMQKVRGLPNGGKPHVTTLSCTVDGKPAAASACKPKRKPKQPMYRVLGAEGRRHYTLRYKRTTKVMGIAAYELEVVPKAKSARHMRGRVAVAADDYRLLMVEGRPADLPFAVKSLYVKMLFVKHGKVASVSKSGYIDVWVHVPLVMKKRITSTFTDSAHKLIAR